MPQEVLSEKVKTRFVTDFVFSSLAIAFFYLTDIFHIQEKSMLLGIFIWTIVIGYVIYSYFITGADQETKNKKITWAAVVIAAFAFLPNWYTLTYVPTFLTFGIYLVLAGSFVFMASKLDGNSKKFVGRLVIILIFSRLQFVAISLTSILLYVSLIASFYLLLVKDNTTLLHEKKFWLSIYLVIFGVIIIMPTIPLHLSKLLDHSSKKRSKRHSMWKEKWLLIEKWLLKELREPLCGKVLSLGPRIIGLLVVVLTR